MCQVFIGTFFIFLYNIRFPLHFLNMQLNGHLPSKTRSRLVSTVAVLGSKTPRQVPTVSNSFFRKLPLQLLFLFCEGSLLFVQILLQPSLKCFSGCRHHCSIQWHRMIDYIYVSGTFSVSFWCLCGC